MFEFLTVELIHFYYGFLILYACFAVVFSVMTTSKYSKLELAVFWSVSIVLVTAINFIVAFAYSGISINGFIQYSYAVGLVFLSLICLLVSDNSLPEKLFKILTNISIFVILDILAIQIARVCSPIIPDFEFALFWCHVGIRTLLYLIYLAVYLLFIKKTLPSVIYQQPGRWWPFVFVALAFALMFIYIKFVLNDAWTYTNEEVNVFLVAVIGFVIVYIAVLTSIHTMIRAEQLSLTEQNEKYMKGQLESLMRAEEEAKKTRHDIRHHNMVILTYAENGENDKIISYISEYDNDARKKALERYCENDIINNIIVSYKSTFEKENIKFNIECEAPKDTRVIDLDYVVILANALENALHGCKESKKDNQECDLVIKTKNQKMSIMIKNTCKNNVAIINGQLVWAGTGVQSMTSALNKYDGEIEYELLDDGYLVLRMLINL